MRRLTSFTHKLLFMALALAVLSAGVTPMVVFSLGYGVYDSGLATKVRVKSEVISRLIASAPKAWTFQEFRLSGMFKHSPDQLTDERATIIGPDGTRIAEIGPALDWPVMEREVELFDAGLPAGRLVLARSMWPLLIETAQAAAVGLGIGAGFFLLLWTVPVRALRMAAFELQKEKDRLLITLRSIADAVVTTDPAGGIESLNPAAERLLGWTQADALGKHVDQIIVLEGEEPGSPRPLPAASSDSDMAYLVKRTGERISVRVSVAAIRPQVNTEMGWVLVLHDINEIRLLTTQLQWQASHDPLTELDNRREFEHRLATALQGVHAEGESHVLMFMDLDQFKVVNDTCGHIAGDQLLCQVTDLLRSRVRRTDCLARLGGDEFGLLLTHCPRVKAEEVAADLLRAIGDERFAWNGKVFAIGMSIGLVELTTAYDNATALLKAADNACYTAKHKGRGRVQVHHPDDATLLASYNQMAWISRITRALDEERFVLYFQRYQALDRGGGEHGEILLRLIDENGQIVPPGAFIPAAERFDLMARLDRWVIREAFKQYGRLRDQTGAIWSINLSGQSLSRDDLLGYILEQAAEHGVPPAGICFEVTETAAINNLVHARALIATLRVKGFRFALDDFGSGLSSFTYLKNLPIDYLKIDGSFVRNLLTDALDHAMVSAIQEISQVLGVSTIAEFVESDALLRELRNIGVDYAQGYVVAAPLPLAGMFDTDTRPQQFAPEDFPALPPDRDHP